MKDRTNARRSVSSLFDPAIIVPAIKDSFRKLHPRSLMRNPVMFVVEIVTVLTTILYFRDINIMRLASPQSAILSAIIFNALIIVALIPLALRGVAYRPIGAASVLRRNLLVYGIGGIIIPFIGIKFIDLIVGLTHLA